MKNHPISVNKNSEYEFIKLFFLLAMLVVMFYGGNNDILVFHIIVELLCIIIAYTMIIIAFNTHKINKDNRIVLLSIAYGFIACFNLIHIISCDEIGLFAQITTPNLSIQVVVAMQFVESVSLLLILAFSKVELDLKKVFMAYLTITLAFFLSIFKFNIFPECYIEGIGLTSFKVISQYVITVIQLLSISLLIKDRNSELKRNSRLILSSLITAILSNIFFSSYMNTHDWHTFVGHVLKLISVYLIYTALVESSIREPQNHLRKKFRQLSSKNLKLNRKYKCLNKKNVSLNKKIVILNKRNRELKSKIDSFCLVNNTSQYVDNKTVLKSEISDSILEGLAEGILVLSNEGRAIYYNNQFLSMWNISGGFAANDEKEIFNCIVDRLSNFEESLSLMEKSWQTNEDYSFTMKIKDKRMFKVDSSLFMDTDIIIGRIFTFRDITDWKRADELQKSFEIQQVRKEETNKYNEMKNSFFSTISHEFRTPLNMILGSIQMMAKMRDDKVDNYNLNIFEKYLNMTKQNSNRLVKLVNNIIDINNIESGFMQLNLKKYNIISIIEDITQSAVKYAEMKGISLVFDTDIEEKIIDCDADKIEKIMLNILSNAVKYTEAEGKIEVLVKDVNKNIVISVKDTGIGIPPNMQQKVFEKFGQVDTSFTRQKEGSGIGLALVKELIELHNGSITLNSELGKGSEFIIELPVNLTDENICDEIIEEREINIEKIDVEFSDIYF